MSIRMERIGEQIRGELARLLRDEVDDPRIGLLTLTRVRVAPDLATASVFWSNLPDGAPEAGFEEDDVARVSAGLESAARFLRKRLARELSLRRTPALRFRHDPSIERGTAMLALLRELDTQPADEDEGRD